MRRTPLVRAGFGSCSRALQCRHVKQDHKKRKKKNTLQEKQEHWLTQHCTLLELFIFLTLWPLDQISHNTGIGRLAFSIKTLHFNEIKTGPP